MIRTGILHNESMHVINRDVAVDHGESFTLDLIQQRFGRSSSQTTNA